MYSQIADVLRAVFILPFTAGTIKDRVNAGYHRHDGSIAGIVLLTTSVIIIFETVIILPNRGNRLLIVGLLCLATISLVIMGILAKCRPHLTRRRADNPVHHIKLKFLWFFCIGNIIFQLLQLVMHQLCKISNKEKTVFWVFLWIFQTLQTGFIHWLSKYKFANVLCLYYGLLVLFVTNISVWTQQTVYTFRVHTTKIPGLNITTDPNGTAVMYSCSGGDWIEEAVVFLYPYLEPFLLEYSLLSLIFLSEMWPKKNRDTFCVHLEDTIESAESSEYDQLIQSYHSNDGLPRRPWNKNSIRVAVIGIVYSMSFSVIQCIYIYIPSTNVDQFTTCLYFLFFLANVVRTPVIVKCFYAMSSELRPKPDQGRNISLNQVIIIISSFATCGYYYLELWRASAHLTVLYWINSMFRSIVTVFQTLFILQMKHYRKTGDQSRFCSAQNTFLFVALVNLGIWVSYTFVDTRFVKYATHTFLDSLWFPFVIFYHFESFIAFYRFFRA